MNSTTARRTVLAARRALTAAVTGAAGIAVLAGAIGAATADATPCTTAACITNVAVTPGGLTAAIAFDTVTPTKDHFEVSYNNSVVAEADYGKFATHHQLTTPASLTPNTTYTWSLQVTGKGGHSVSKAGTLTTLHRQVDVLFSTITVTNDSDADSPGDFRTWVRAGGSSHIDNQVPEEISDGTTVLASDLIRIRDVGDTIPVYTEMLDNDSFNPVLPTSQLPFPNDATWTNGSSLLWDWATVMVTLPTHDATNGLWSFQQSVNANVGFVLHGYYSVTFVS